MSVTLKPISKIKVDLGIDPSGRVQKYFTKRCRDRMDKYVPMDTGILRNNTHLTAESITYQTKYAHKQYTTQFSPENYTTPGTGPYWDKRMISAEKDKLIREVKAYMKRG